MKFLRCENFRTTVHGCKIFACAKILATLFMGAKFSHLCLFSSFVLLTSDDHNFFVRTPFEVFFDSMEIPLSQESRFMPVEDKWGSQPC